MQELSVKIKIGDRTYPMTVTANNELLLRKAGKQISEKVDELSITFGRMKDQQDLLAMVAIELLVENMKLKESQKINDEIVSKQISKLSKLVSVDL